MKFDNDEKLIQALRAGGREEHEALVYLSEHEGYRKAVRNNIMNNGGQLADVDPIYNEGVFALYKKVNLISEELIPLFQVGAYLYITCRFLWYKELAKRKARQGLLNRLASLFKRKRDSDLFTQSAFDKQKLELVEQIIDEMGEPCRTILLMSELGESFAKIAEVLSISSAGNARVKKHRCAKELQKRVRERLQGER